MKLKTWNYEDGKLTIKLVDIESKPLGIFIATDFELIKSLRNANLNNLELVFKEVKNESI